jgi:hypothetical protein
VGAAVAACRFRFPYTSKDKSKDPRTKLLKATMPHGLTRTLAGMFAFFVAGWKYTRTMLTPNNE